MSAILTVLVWFVRSKDHSFDSNSHKFSFKSNGDSAESIPHNWIPRRMNGNTDDSNDAPATLPQHDITP